MPQLPSGTHIAADPAPLRALLADARSAFNAHDIMSLEFADDLLGWVNMLVPDPDDPASSTPVGRLSAWREYADAHEWDEADRLAMREFIAERIIPAMERTLLTVLDAQAALLKSPTTAGALARCWCEGVHPLQVEAE